MRALLISVLVLGLAGCGLIHPRTGAPASGEPAGCAGEPAAGGAPPPSARTVEEFDTTTAAERKAAAAAPVPKAAALGRTIASLGDPAEPGFWLETPLVTEVRKGHVVLPATGASAEVELRPIAGPASAGSRISLAALRLLGVALTDLPEIEVYAG